MKVSGVLMFLFLAIIAVPVQAKRVICIDQTGGFDDGFIHNAEGYERVRARTDGAVIDPVIGGDLIKCLAKVANNDELVIIAHGTHIPGIRTGFKYNGKEYRGFGNDPNDPNLAPVPPGFAALRGVRVTFFACYSSLDVDGPGGPQMSMLNSLITAMGGPGNHPAGTGFVGQASPNVVPVLKPDNADAAKAEKKLRQSQLWVRKPPVNRPEAANDNQRTAAQALVNADPEIGAGKVTVEIADAIADPDDQESSGYILETETPFSEEIIAQEDECECEDCDGRGLIRPSCLLHALRPGPPVVLEVLTQDETEGLCAIHVLQARNASVDIPSFTPGELGPVIVTATKIDQMQSSTVLLRVENCEGLIKLCDPVLSLVVREAGKPVRYNFPGIPQAESTIEVHNGTPGLRNVEITVNGVLFHATLLDGEVWTLDAASVMVPGEGNVVTIEGRGTPGGSALLVIHD